MKRYVFFTLLLFFIAINVSGVEARSRAVACGNCHGFPPGIGKSTGSFYPGAHGVHRYFTCDRCHITGDKPDHVNGAISIRPEIMYSAGIAVAWPGSGSGSCGGDNISAMPSGCHAKNHNQKCFWFPGKACKKVTDP